MFKEQLILLIAKNLSEEACGRIIARIGESYLANEIQVYNKRWEENLHPRASDGRFASKGSGSYHSPDNTVDHVSSPTSRESDPDPKTIREVTAPDHKGKTPEQYLKQELAKYERLMRAYGFPERTLDEVDAAREEAKDDGVDISKWDAYHSPFDSKRQKRREEAFRKYKETLKKLEKVAEVEHEAAKEIERKRKPPKMSKPKLQEKYHEILDTIDENNNEIEALEEVIEYEDRAASHEDDVAIDRAKKRLPKLKRENEILLIRAERFEKAGAKDERQLDFPSEVISDE